MTRSGTDRVRVVGARSGAPAPFFRDTTVAEVQRAWGRFADRILRATQEQPFVVTEGWTAYVLWTLDLP